MNPTEQLMIDQPRLRQLPAIVPLLLTWYDRNARDLPWRKSPTPYHVWVSEIMLQQTRVEAVRGYYARFLEALPTISTLAAAEEGFLLKLWEGLGYYSRVRNLQKAAQTVMAEHQGALPASHGALLRLPGIGEYTAGAIASIAFGIPVPAVDGNVLRVISRLIGSYADISSPAVKQAHREILSEIIPQNRPGDFNQALMELGAMICLPNGAPKCLECPLCTICAAGEGGFAQELPIKPTKKARRIEQRTIIQIVAEKNTLLFRRGKGLLAGMYEPLNVEGHLLDAAIRAEVTKLGGTVQSIQPLDPSKHIFTHVEWHMIGYRVSVNFFTAPENTLWANAQELDEKYALPSAFSAYTKTIFQ